ncbi:RNA polymerase sigma-70 factor [Pseudonocardia spinosispora]|uniref:RNA polymerase sigma-70 factor n=1 Tax=Pseudonocardia spinosispora TaxID=103441 RepID=UPI000424393B|nr:RNA polymerase sigma-70 factor [Pseudonocardia spinosispora]
MAIPASEVALFEGQRTRLFGLAYRMLGSATEAEDVVQDVYLRWHGAHHETIQAPSAWLAKVATNLCLTRLTSARARRERYVGPWLPEPVLTATGALGPLETVEQRESVSMGVLLLLERLSPLERAVLVLRDAFGHRHREIADVLGIAEDHSRQLHHRARQHVAAERVRFENDPERHQALVRRFFDAALHGDVATLEQLLAEDVVSWADGGGATTAARRPITGRPAVLRYLLGIAHRPEAVRVTVEIAEINGGTAVLPRLDGTVLAVLVPEISAGLVSRIRLVLNPAKLRYLTAQLE